MVGFHKFWLGNKFTPAVQGPQPVTHEGNRLLNYIWISDSNRRWLKLEPPKPISDHYVRNVVATARENPDTKILVWVDSPETNQNAEQFFTGQGPGNIFMRDLHTMPLFNSDPVFQKHHRGYRDIEKPVFQKSDLARIAVIDHLFTATDANEIFYYDFDLGAPPASSPQVQKILNRHGMVLASDNRNHLMLENQYMGFRRSQRDFIRHELLPATQAAVHKGDNGWNALCMKVSNHITKGNTAWIDTITVRTREIGREDGAPEPVTPHA